MNYSYSHMALGGTFDRLHLGHHHLLQTALDSAKQVHIGLTQNNMVQDKQLAGLILPYDRRKKELQSFLDTLGALHRCQIIPLTDMYGPTLTNPKLDALAVTPQTLSGAKQINSQRKKVGLIPLPIIQADLIVDDAGEYLSSTKIRLGQVSRQGQVYAKLFHKNIHISDETRQQLSLPQGKLLHSIDQVRVELEQSQTTVALVGDFITQWFDDHKLPFDIAVVDGKNQRQPFKLHLNHFQPTQKFRATNPAGGITTQTYKAILSLLNTPKSLLTINGEEDLCAIPLLLSLPLGSLVFYGQPGAGIVIMETSESNKHKFAQLIK